MVLLYNIYKTERQRQRQRQSQRQSQRHRHRHRQTLRDINGLGCRPHHTRHLCTLHTVSSCRGFVAPLQYLSSIKVMLPLKNRTHRILIPLRIPAKTYYARYIYDNILTLFIAVVVVFCSLYTCILYLWSYICGSYVCGPTFLPPSQ